MRSEWPALLALAALAGCMDAADYTEAITGERPEVSLPPPLLLDAEPEPEPDAAPPDVGCTDPPSDCERACRATCVADRWRCPLDTPPDVCGGGDTDCDGRLDEQAPSPSSVGAGEAMCCDGRAEPPCNGAPAGTWLDPGWVYAPAGGVLVMAAEVTVGAWAALPATRDLPPRGCERRADGARDDPALPMECVDLFGAAAYANAWSCARGRTPCYRIGDDPARPVDARERLGALTYDPSCTGARLASPALFAALEAAAAADDCAAAGCCLDDTAPVDALGVDRLGLRGVRGNVREWLWPDEGAALDRDSLVAPGGGYFGGCGATEPMLAGSGLADAYAYLGLRLVCPAEDGTTNACTGPARGEGLCR